MTDTPTEGDPMTDTPEGLVPSGREHEGRPTYLGLRRSVPDGWLFIPWRFVAVPGSGPIYKWTTTHQLHPEAAVEAVPPAPSPEPPAPPETRGVTVSAPTPDHPRWGAPDGPPILCGQAVTVVEPIDGDWGGVVSNVHYDEVIVWPWGEDGGDGVECGPESLRLEAPPTPPADPEPSFPTRDDDPEFQRLLAEEAEIEASVRRHHDAAFRPAPVPQDPDLVDCPDCGGIEEWGKPCPTCATTGVVPAWLPLLDRLAGRMEAEAEARWAAGDVDWSRGMERAARWLREAADGAAPGPVPQDPDRLTSLVDAVEYGLAECELCEAQLPNDCARLLHFEGCPLGDLLAALRSEQGEAEAQGQVSLADVWRISDTGVNALAILASAVGVTRDEMKEMISSGAVRAGEVLDALIEQARAEQGETTRGPEDCGDTR